MWDRDLFDDIAAVCLDRGVSAARCGHSQAGWAYGQWGLNEQRQQGRNRMPDSGGCVRLVRAVFSGIAAVLCVERGVSGVHLVPAVCTVC